MARIRSIGRLRRLRVHREIGYGPPNDNIPVHVVVKLDDDSPRETGFPLLADENQLVHEAWMAMLRDAAVNPNLTVDILADHDTERGHHGVIRDLTLTRG